MLNNLFVKKTLNATSISLLCATFLSQSVLGMNDDYYYKDNDSDTTNSTYIEEDSEETQPSYRDQPVLDKYMFEDFKAENYIVTSSSSIYIEEDRKEDPQAMVQEALLLLKKEKSENYNYAIHLLNRAHEKRNRDATFSLGELAAKEGKPGEAKWYFKLVIKETNNHHIKKCAQNALNKLEGLERQELEKQELEEIINEIEKKELEEAIREIERQELKEIERKKTNKIWKLKDRFSDNLSTARKNLNESKKASSLTKSAKVLPEYLRGSCKNLKQKDEPTLKLDKKIETENPFTIINVYEEEIIKSLPILKLGEKIETKNTFKIINVYEEEIIKSLPTLKINNDTVSDRKNNPHEDLQGTLKKLN